MSPPVNPTAPTRVFDLFEHQLASYPQPDAVVRKIDGRWQSFSAQQIASISRALAAGLHSAGIRPGDRVGSTAETNRPEWNFLDLALTQLGAVHVPIYPTLTEDEFHFILEDAGIQMIFVASADLHAKLSTLAVRLPSLTIYTWDAVPRARSWSELHDQGASLLASDPATASTLDTLRTTVQPSDLAMLIYTSGTTGHSQGVMLSHANLVSNCLAIVPLIDGHPGERALCCLPLCHIFERTMNNAYLYSGMPVYYPESLDHLGDNLREVKPTLFSVVPRILEKAFERILTAGKVLEGSKRGIFFWALALAERIDPEAETPPSFADRLRLKLADRLVFSHWRKALGGKIRAISCGSAALHPRLARIFWNAGIPVCEGYGLTESSPVITSNRHGEHEHLIGTVGPVIDGGEIRFSPDGEVLYRGTNVMLGYYRRPDLTAAAIDEEGFLHTGDIGEFLTDRRGMQFLKITGRKKEIFKTSGGKYIAPQLIENQLKTSPFIAQIMVVGEYQKFPGALIVPNFPAIRERLSGPLPSADSELAASPVVRELIETEINRLNPGLAQYAQIKNFDVLPHEWTSASGELTVTQKLKRQEITKKYAAEIDRIYAEKAS